MPQDWCPKKYLISNHAAQGGQGLLACFFFFFKKKLKAHFASVVHSP